ncbi:DUF7619 domain-containing protein [Flavobacterium sp. SM2513]|uniref:DUF7619 domain-containing protein n=1 Tax=Flavobacterium sp. SM2513 TaxID=3424766 RepID=UPI003D7F5810
MKKLYTLLVVVLTTLSSTAQIVNIPDANFKNKLLSASPSNWIASTQTPDVNGNVTSYNKIDTNNDGQIQVSEALAIKYLKIYDTSGGTLLIYTANGIQSFTNLEYLMFQISSFTFSNITTLTNLRFLNCVGVNLTTSNLTNLVNLTYLNLSFNSPTLDVSHMTKLKKLYCSSISMTRLNIKNGSNEIDLSFQGCYNLRFICADEDDITLVQNKIDNYGYTFTCQANTYCNFVMGGEYHTIQGNSLLDIDNNGCDNNDIYYPNMKVNISNEVHSAAFIGNNLGIYSIPVFADTYTILPQIENPSYFNISPTSASVSFPSTASPYTQDFCITANGIHNDVEVSILPIVPARPGFDAKYKIIYKNKGNQVSNGSLSFTFDDAVMDLISTTPLNSSSATNSLSWTYSNLNPFETREINLTFNINSPMENPAVNAGTILNYTATIVGATDEMPNDNTFTLNQTVVNSFDPNDKTCLEGTTITPSMIGEYVHYVIRFENTGTFAAQNIVVSDVIDTTKFEISSLVAQSSSHSYITRINSTTGKVEFIFENINLPFDDANNDGYVAFKIKTKSTLVLGNTFSNTASIYFDYNFPIITNTAITTIATLSNQDFDFGSYFTVYPIPAKDVLHFNTKNEIVLKSISIYNTLGQMVMAVTNPENNTTIDVANLKTGTYFIKVMTNKGTANTKFIKE